MKNKTLGNTLRKIVAINKMCLTSLVTGMFVPPGTPPFNPNDYPMFPNDHALKAAIHQRVNDVGTSRYETFMTYPQPEPIPNYSEPGTHVKSIINSKSSINYINSKHELLAGITELSKQESRVLLKRMFKEAGL